MDWFERLTGVPPRATTKQVGCRVDGAELVSDRQRPALRHWVADPADPGRTARAVNPLAAGVVRSGALVGDVRAARRASYARRAVPGEPRSSTCWRWCPSGSPRARGRPLRRRPRRRPACAMARPAATICHQHLVPVGDGIRTAQRAPARRAGRCRRGADPELTGLPVEALWRMQNGCAQSPARERGRSATLLGQGRPEEASSTVFAAQLAIGLHRDVEVTRRSDRRCRGRGRRLVSQAFCSALPVSYSRLSRSEYWCSPASCWRLPHEGDPAGREPNRPRPGPLTRCCSPGSAGAPSATADEWIDWRDRPRARHCRRRCGLDDPDRLLQPHRPRDA